MILKNLKFLLGQCKKLLQKRDFPNSNDNETKIMGNLREKVFMFYLAELFQIKESVSITH